ncbi:MAG: hypothetical protein ORN83_04610 [Chthoniobacteraceae bacterium]|nr:hypothetical protein [Chthoniobacteraceae bacterium]
MQTHSRANLLPYLTCFITRLNLKGSFLRLAILVGISTLVSPSISTAQSPPELVAPQGPAWIRPERPMGWTITFRYANSPKPPAVEERPLKITVTAVGTRSLQTIRYAKTGFNIWAAEGYSFMVDPETGGFEMHPIAKPLSPTEEAPVSSATAAGVPEPEPAAESTDWTALAEFDWVKSNLFQGSIKMGNDLLHVYALLPEEMLAARLAAATAARPIAGRPAAPAAKAPPAPKWPAGTIGGLPLRPDIKVVAVDANTRRPRYLQLGEDIREYVFTIPNETNLELPAPIQKRLKAMGL